MADTLLTSYPLRTLTHVLGHDSSNLVGKLDVSSLGGSGTPGGSATQVQYNNAGVFGGITDTAVSGDTVTFRKIRTAGFSGASGAHFIGDGGGGWEFSSGAAFYNLGGGSPLAVHSTGLILNGLQMPLAFRIGRADAGLADTAVYQQGVGTLALALGTTAHNLRVYKTITAGSEILPTAYERAVFDWSTTANTLTIGTQHAGGTLWPVNIVGSALTFNGSPIVGGPGGLATISDTPPAVGAAGSFWWESDTGALHISYSSAWVAVTPVPAALTRTNDTNVTLTLGGTPGTALAQPVSLTLGWTGTLSTARGGTGNTSYTVGDILYASSTTVLSPLLAGAWGTFLTSAGPSLPPVWSSIPSLVTKATPDTADWLLLSDTADSGELKKIAWTAGGGPGGGSPGGSTTELQYRIDGSTFGAMAGTVWDNTNRSLTMAGDTVTGVTTSNPVLNLTQKWNAGAITFSGIKFDVTNTASTVASMLIDLRVDGASKFMVRRDGCVGLEGQGAIQFTGNGIIIGRLDNAFPTYYPVYIGVGSYSGIHMGQDQCFGWHGGDYGLNTASTIGVYLRRHGDGVLAQVNLAKPQTFHLYNSTNSDFTPATYSRIAVKWVSNVGYILPEVDSGTVLPLIVSTGLATVAAGAAQIPAASAALAGARAMVSDSSVTTFGTALTGGGSSIVPVYCTGAGWFVG